MVTRLLTLVFLAVAAGRLPAAERPLALDLAQSRVEVEVRATVDSFTGKLVAFDPVVAVGDDGRIVAARFGFHFRDLETGKPKRDAAMHKWQDTTAFPNGVFVLSDLAPAPAPAAGFVASGRLTLHGATQELRFPVTVQREGERYAIDGDAPVDVRGFGLPIIRLLGVLKVDPVVHVRFHLQGRLNP